MNKLQKIIAVVTVGLAVVASIWLATPSEAAKCSDFNVVSCGTHTIDEINRQYNSDAAVRSLYDQFKVSHAISYGLTMKTAYVNSDNQVTTLPKSQGRGQILASNARTLQGKAGSLQVAPERQYSYHGRTFHQYTAKQSFVEGVTEFEIFAWFDANGKFVVGIIKDCGNPVWDGPTPPPTPTPPQKPALTCKALKKDVATKQVDQEFTFTAEAGLVDGATVTNYTFDFGDGTKQTTTSSVVKHKYSQPGTYTIKLTVNGKEGSASVSKTGANCEQTVTVTPEPTIVVCRLEDKKYPVTIKESEFDETKHSKNPADCKEEDKDIIVCRLEDKKYPVTIKQSEFNSAKHSTNKEDCKTPTTPPATPPTTPNELPRTGVDLTLSAIGLVSLTTAVLAYITSRRQL